MSKLSGDTARGHRLRKQNIARRMKIRALRKELEAAKAAAAPKAPAK